jgi:hypothetical protein
MAVKWFEMDETEMICTGWIPKFDKRYVVIDFLPTPPNKELRRTAWRFTIAKEINETLNSFNDV